MKQEDTANNEPEYIILVDEHDNQVGTAEKLRVHQHGLLHRAFSVFIFNANKELLIQQRAASKYHSGGLWSNTCCSHYRPGEEITEAPPIRLFEEMGFSCALTRLFSYTYKVYIEKDQLYEHETDHIFLGYYNGAVSINQQEVAASAWIDAAQLLNAMYRHPDEYTYWFKELVAKVLPYA